MGRSQSQYVSIANFNHQKLTVFFLVRDPRVFAASMTNLGTSMLPLAHEHAVLKLRAARA
jgi:hypothetical protein